MESDLAWANGKSGR